MLETRRNFVNLLSAPRQLKALTNSEIPDLRPDFELRAYQLEGVTWLQFLANYGLNGILADDMGLGKTVQVNRFLRLRARKRPILDFVSARNTKTGGRRIRRHSESVADRVPPNAREPLARRMVALFSAIVAVRQVRGVYVEREAHASRSQSDGHLI